METINNRIKQWTIKWKQWTIKQNNTIEAINNKVNNELKQSTIINNVCNNMKHWHNVVNNRTHLK
jgi:hypothetical protein